MNPHVILTERRASPVGANNHRCSTCGVAMLNLLEVQKRAPAPSEIRVTLRLRGRDSVADGQTDRRTDGRTDANRCREPQIHTRGMGHPREAAEGSSWATPRRSQQQQLQEGVESSRRT